MLGHDRLGSRQASIDTVGFAPQGGGRSTDESAAADIAADLEVDERIDRAFDGAAARLVLGSSDPLAVAGQAGTVIVVGILAPFILAGGRRIVDLLIRLARRTITVSGVHGLLAAGRCRRVHNDLQRDRRG